MQYKDAEGNTVTVRAGKCYKGKPVNSYTDEQRAEIGLFPMPVPEPYEPTIEEQREAMVVTPWQIRKALNQTGRRGDVNSAMNTADQDTQDGWEYATSFERLNPLVIDLGTALGMSDTELDDLFILAATL